VNLQQYYMEAYLIDRARELSDRIDLRWKNRVVGVQQDARGVRAEVETPDGRYTLRGEYLLACDGAKSPIRNMLDLEFGGRQFEERFLIADVQMQADFPSERWFWFEPPFHPGQSTLLHKQPDDIYRIDFQLGPDADPEAEKRPERVRPRVAAMVGHEDFELDWVSVYAFKCCRLEKFVHDRIVFAGDSAHVVSPFGARGGNGGLHDVDNLGWKLAAVVKGEAPASLLGSYDRERIHGADENILNSARATGFMTPKTATDKLFRDAVLGLAADYPFARRLVNSGRLSVPCSLAGFDLQTDPADEGTGVAPGEACPDAPVDGPDGPGWLLHHLGGDFVLLAVDTAIPAVAGVRALPVATRGDAPTHGLVDRAGWVAARYGTGKLYLIRPDQHVAARFATADGGAVEAALQRAQGRTEASHAVASHA
jgi:3-(3-hydroxy-phenyl)propionate hydroxylase